MAHVVVAGGSMPLNANNLIQTLGRSLLPNQIELTASKEQLETWESRSEYIPALLEVISNQTLPQDIRFQAAVQLKGTISRRWRKSQALLNTTQKAQVRSSLLQAGFSETNNAIAEQLAVAITKIVRIDWLGDWSNVFELVITEIRHQNSASNTPRLKRALRILLLIVKELSTLKIRTQQANFHRVAPEILLYLSTLYRTKVQTWFSALTSGSTDIDSMEVSLLTQKIDRRLMVDGYEFPTRATDVQRLWGETREDLVQFLDLLKNNQLQGPAREMLEKHVKQSVKCHLAMAQTETHFYSFISLPGTIQLLGLYWEYIVEYATNLYPTLDSDDNSLESYVALKALLLLHECIRDTARPPTSTRMRDHKTKEEQNAALETFKKDFFTAANVTGIAQLLMDKFFIIRRTDVEGWEASPEEWEDAHDEYNSAENTGFEVDLRLCAEKCFGELCKAFRTPLQQPLADFFGTLGPNSTVPDKESAYTALGLAAPILDSTFDFVDFMKTTLVADMGQTAADYRILRRRIAILIAKWIPVKIPTSSRPLVYEIFGALIDSDNPLNDMCVRITAVRHFWVVVNDFEFLKDDFLPFVPGLLNKIVKLLQDIDNTYIRAKEGVIDTINSICNMIDEDIATFADVLVKVICEIWEANEDQYQLKLKLLGNISTIITNTHEQSVRYYATFIPIIQNAVRPDDPNDKDSQSCYWLFDDAVQLWTTIMTQCPTENASLVLPLFESLFPHLNRADDSLHVTLTLLHSYVLIAPGALLEDGMRLRLFTQLASLLGSTQKREWTGQITQSVGHLIRAAKTLGGDEGVQVVATDLITSGLFAQVLTDLKNAFDCHEHTGPNAPYPTLDDRMETDYFAILARLLCASPAVFFESLRLINAGNAHEIWDWLAAEWFRHFDSMSMDDARKLNMLALTRVLELPDADKLVLQPSPRTKSSFLASYFTMWTDVIGKLLNGTGKDSEVWEPRVSEDGGAWISADTGAENNRDLDAQYADEVHTVDSLPFVHERLQLIVSNNGGEARFSQEYIAVLDQDVVSAFQQLSLVKPEVIP